MTDIPLYWFLIVGAGLFSLGVFGVVTRKNAVGVLMGIELMLNAVNLNAVALWRYTAPAHSVRVGESVGQYVTSVDGQVFAIFVIALAAAEATIGLAMIISIYRSRQSIDLETLDALQG